MVLYLIMDKGRVKKHGYPRPVYDKSCHRGTIHRTGCNTWVHPACVPTTDAKFDDYGQSEDYFLCPHCISTSESDVGMSDISKCFQLPEKISGIYWLLKNWSGVMPTGISNRYQFLVPVG